MPILDESNCCPSSFKKIEWGGRVQHRDNKKGTNIIQHVLTNLDDSAEYKLNKDGSIMVRDSNFKDGRYHREKKFIPLREHNKKHYPMPQNPVNKINRKKLLERDKMQK